MMKLIIQSLRDVLALPFAICGGLLLVFGGLIGGKDFIDSLLETMEFVERL